LGLSRVVGVDATLTPDPLPPHALRRITVR